MALTLVDAPEVEPILLEEAKQHVRKTDAQTDEDGLFENILIPAVRDRAELHTQRQLITATWCLYLDAWPCEGWIDVPRAPLQSVTSITYVDQNGDTQTLAADQYIVDAPAGPRCQRGRILPAYNVIWPTVRPQANAIAITFVAGYGDDGGTVPGLLRQAMLRDLGTLYEHREDVVAGVTVEEMPSSSRSVYRSFKSRPAQRRDW